MTDQRVSPPRGFPSAPPVWHVPGSSIHEVAPPGPGPFGGTPPPPDEPRPFPGTDQVEAAPYGVWRQRIGGGLAALGSAMLVLGTFADWVHADIPGLGPRVGNGWHNVHGHVSHGPWILALALVSGILAAMVVAGVRRPWIRPTAVSAALVAWGFVAFELWDIHHPGVGVVARMQPGIWVMVFGAVLAMAGALTTTSRPA